MNIPNPGEKETWHPTEDTIAFLSTHYDQFMENPCEEWDGIGMIHSFSTKHVNFLRLDADTQEEAVEELDETFGDDWLLLGYFEHGRCIWHLSGHIPRGAEGDYRWDGVHFAGVWVPDDCLLKEAEGLESDERMAKMCEWAGQACEIYTQWCNGDIFGYSFEVYQYRAPYDQKNDYRFSAPEHEVSCRGFFGWDSLEEVIEEVIAGYDREGIQSGAEDLPQERELA